MNLIVDIGNTLVKLAVADEGRIVVQRRVERLHAGMLDELCAAWPLHRAIVASTRGDAGEVAGLVRTRVPRCVEFTPQTPVPIANVYDTPQTLGRDRLAAAVGAVAHWPERNVLIVDFGTALTIDLVTADGIYLGGFISPGVRSRFRSLHDYTAQLPLCGPTEEPAALGTTTESSVVAGVMRSMQYEIEGHVARMGALYPDLCVIFTGGDAKYFAKRIKNTIFADCNLVLCGLDRILAYNASEENPE